MWFKIGILVLFCAAQLSSSSCPYGCNCSDTQLLCIGKKLESVPNLVMLDSVPQVIDLSGNKLTYISGEDFSFEKNDAVQEIYLNNSEIVEIEKGAFDEVENLQELYLGQNLLNKVSEFIIEPLDSMVLLDLSNNYFNGDMPVIRSQSLEVLAMANSKVSNIPKDALKHLPNLKLLLLTQNNIKTISLDVFEPFKESSLLVKLSHNPIECSCQNFDLFQRLESKKFIDLSEPYQCRLVNGSFVNIFGKNGDINGDPSDCNDSFVKRNLITKELDSEFSNFKDVRSMVADEESTPQKEETTCEDFAGLFLIKFKPENSFFAALLLAIILSCFIGFFTGILFIKILYANKYQKLAQRDSESTSKLVLSS